MRAGDAGLGGFTIKNLIASANPTMTAVAMQSQANSLCLAMKAQIAIPKNIAKAPQDQRSDGGNRRLIIS